MKTPRRTFTKAAGRPAPTLDVSPFEPLEPVGSDNLSEADRTYLQEREGTIEAGRRTFLEVGQALLDIRSHRGGLLYKRYGTFEAYCQERWEFGRSYASRIMDAAEIYREMLPRGNKAGVATPVLPTTEKQIRSLKKLPPDKRFEAWNNAVESTGAGPVHARNVDREVRKLLVKEDAAPAAKPERQRTTAGLHRVSAQDVKKILAELVVIKRWSGKGEHASKIHAAVEHIESLLSF